jgi:FlaG/FlaF family flagellin (archaellin)
MDRAAGDHGQASPLVALVLVFAVVAALAATELGVTVSDRAQARTAADAAALAGVTGGRGAADAVAAANHGSLERFVVADGDTDVTVRVGRARATARARAGRPVGQPAWPMADDPSSGP